MSHRRRAFFIVCLTVVVLAFLPGAVGDSHTYVEDRSFRFYPVIQDESLFAGDFGPNGTDAYLVGGSFGREPAPDDQYMIRYNGASWKIVYKETGTSEGPLMDIGWQPGIEDYALIPAAGGTDRTGSLDGSILACFQPCENASHVRDLWDPRYTAHAANSGFAGRQVDWHPSGEHALITGSGLLRYNHNFWTDNSTPLFTTVVPGEKTLFNAVEWHPDGDFALVQRDLNRVQLCVDPCNTSADLRETNVAFGESDGSKAIESFSFHPSGDKAYVMGVDKQRSKLMEIVFGENPTDFTSWTINYYNPTAQTSDGKTYNKYGEITSMSWYPDGSKALLTSSLRQQVNSFPAQPEGRHDFTRLLDLDGPKLYDGAMAADGKYTLFGASGGFYRYDPDGVPIVNVTTPATGDDPEFVSSFDVRGTAEPKRDDRNITTIQWKLEDQAQDFGASPTDEWNNLSADNWTRAEDGTLDWSFSLDASTMQPGRYVLGVRADDGEVLGPPGLTTFRVPGPEVHIGSPGNHTLVDGDVAVEGSAEARAADSEITGVEYRVTPTRAPSNPQFGPWFEANLTDGPGHNVTWDFAWDASTRSCYQTVAVRAIEDEIVGRPSHTVHYVPGCLSDPVNVTVQRVDDRNQTVTLNWTKVDAATAYNVEFTSANDQGFFEATTLATLEGHQTHFTHHVNATGDFRYRVNATNQYEESPWGQTVGTVEEYTPPPDDGDGSDGDGTDDGDGSDSDGTDDDLIGGDNDTDDPSTGTGDDPGSGEDPGDNTSGGPAGAPTPGPGVASAVAAAALAALRRRRP